jgi:hypothetical protein
MGKVFCYKIHRCQRARFVATGKTKIFAIWNMLSYIIWIGKTYISFLCLLFPSVQMLACIINKFDQGTRILLYLNNRCMPTTFNIALSTPQSVCSFCLSTIWNPLNNNKYQISQRWGLNPGLVKTDLLKFNALSAQPPWLCFSCIKYQKLLNTYLIKPSFYT